MFNLSISKISLREWLLFEYNKIKLLLIINVRVIIKYCKSTSFKNTFNYLKNTFSSMKKLSNK